MALTDKEERMKSKQQQNKNAGLYYRLSKDDERAGESLSIENQKLMLRKFATEQGFTVIDKTPPPEKKYLSTPTCENC